MVATLQDLGLWPFLKEETRTKLAELLAVSGSDRD